MSPQSSTYVDLKRSVLNVKLRLVQVGTDNTPIQNGEVLANSLSIPELPEHHGAASKLPELPRDVSELQEISTEASKLPELPSELRELPG